MTNPNYVEERLRDLVSCSKPKLWDSIAAALAIPEHKEALRGFALMIMTSYNIACEAARMYARVRAGEPIEGDPVLTHKSTTVREQCLEGAADVADYELVLHYTKDEHAQIAYDAGEYLSDLSLFPSKA